MSNMEIVPTSIYVSQTTICETDHKHYGSYWEIYKSVHQKKGFFPDDFCWDEELSMKNLFDKQDFYDGNKKELIKEVTRELFQTILNRSTAVIGNDSSKSKKKWVDKLFNIAYSNLQKETVRMWSSNCYYIKGIKNELAFTNERTQRFGKTHIYHVRVNYETVLPIDG